MLTEPIIDEVKSEGAFQMIGFQRQISEVKSVARFDKTVQGKDQTYYTDYILGINPTYHTSQREVSPSNNPEFLRYYQS